MNANDGVDHGLRRTLRPLFADIDPQRFGDRVRSGREQLRFNEPDTRLGWNAPADDPDDVEQFWQDLGRP